MMNNWINLNYAILCGKLHNCRNKQLHNLFIYYDIRKISKEKPFQLASTHLR